MNEKGNRYALAALRHKRASLAGEIVQLERQLKYRKESLGHVDATLRLLDPTSAPNAIPNKRAPKHIKLFRQGELGRMILGTLRKADDRPLSTWELVKGVLDAGGHGEDARASVAPRVRSNLAYLEKRALVIKTGKASGVRWTLA